MPDNYINIMIQSLLKKEKVLDQILQLSREQADLLEDPNLEPEDFEKNIDDKAACIEELESLDTGFERLYEEVAEQLKNQKDQYKDEIAKMQECIRRITEKSMDIQSREARNKELAAKKFSDVRKQVKQIRDSQKVVKQYYDNMRKRNFVDPQFMDNKK